ncbi:MAG TPA: choice-of-anchor P family protein [Planctomycetota bacterium]|nr:choice-of-anchor P family protein [Planctomycetota bacterium]
MKISRVSMRSASLLGLLMAILLIPGQAISQDGNGNGNGKKKNGGGGAGGGEQVVATTYGGRATVLKAAVAGVGTTICDTGAMPETGGCLEASAVNASVAGLLTGKVCHAACVAQGHHSRAEASMESLSITVGLYTITCGFMMTRADAACAEDGTASVTGWQEGVALAVNGTGIASNGEPNQENVNFLGLKIIINEQITAVDGNSASITVNGLHIILKDILLGTVLADVVVCSSTASIVCGGGENGAGHLEVSDRLTGGGFITGTPSGAKGNFGVAGGFKNGALWGHLNYIDHGTGMHVKHVTITDYEATSPNERKISGTCEINGQGGFGFSVFAADNGEPGSSDTFNIFLSNGYSAGGYLGGGNIQLHKN